MVIVSASPECYVRPAGELLGVDGVLATRLAVGGGGLLTGGYEGKNCRGAEKYARLVVHLRAHGFCSEEASDQPELWAYGNSRGDLRLLRAADHGVDAGLLGPSGACGGSPASPTWSGRPTRPQSDSRTQPGLAAIAHHAARVAGHGGRHVAEVGRVAEAEGLPGAVDHRVPLAVGRGDDGGHRAPADESAGELGRRRQRLGASPKPCTVAVGLQHPVAGAPRRRRHADHR